MARLPSRALSPSNRNDFNSEQAVRVSSGSDPNWDWNESTEWSDDGGKRNDNEQPQNTGLDADGQP